MLKPKRLPPPEKFTVRDALQILLGLVMIPLGAMILYNTLRLGAVVPALLIGGAFLAFGAYRTLFAWGRVRWYRETHEGRKHG
jgi:uncharacterized membrane protein HdeD (DUF308 family)